MKRGPVACTDIDGLMQTLSINHIPLDWQLFIDSSKLSLKAIFLHSGNTLPSIPLGHSVHNKESYENMKILMEAVNYDKFKLANLWWPKSDCLTTWTTRRIHKILLLHCDWDSTARSLHYSRKDWPARKSLEPGIMNVENQPLVELSKILLPAMHLKLGLTKNSVKATNQEETAFAYLRESSPD